MIFYEFKAIPALVGVKMIVLSFLEKKLELLMSGFSCEDFNNFIFFF